MDIKLNYIDKGSGIPLVLLHGNGEDLTYFNNQIEYFSKSYRVIAVDTRGHGKSNRGTKAFTMDQFVEDLVYLLDSLNIDKIILLGFSDGANIAMKFAIKYQNRLKLLILNSGNLYYSGAKKSIQIIIKLGYYLLKFFEIFNPKLKLKREIIGLMIYEPNLKEEDLHSINVPTLVIAGKKDMIKEEHTRLIARNLKYSSLVIIPGDHFVANKNPNIFNKEIEEYLNLNKD